MKKKTTKTKGGRGNKKTAEGDSSGSTSFISSPPEHQAENLQKMQETLPELDVPSPPLPPKSSTFKEVFSRLEEARTLGQGLEISLSEVDLIYHRFLSIEQQASRLPASIENSSKGLPPEIWEFISRGTPQGTFEANAERNRKWVDFLSKRSWEYLQRITDTILFGPSGAEKEAAETICSLIFLLIQKLRRASQISTPARLVGRDAAKEAYDKVISSCHRTLETTKKRERRNAEYQKRGRKKAHKGYFAFQCEDWARGIIFNHEDWLEDGEGDPPTFAKFPRPMPTKRFGMDTADRAEWENWFFLALEHNIVKAGVNGSSMKEQWRSHRSDLRNRLIPGYWDKAPMWRSMREHFERDA